MLRMVQPTGTAPAPPSAPPEDPAGLQLQSWCQLVALTDSLGQNSCCSGLLFRLVAQADLHAPVQPLVKLVLL